MIEMLHSEQEIQGKYEGSDVADQYVATRFRNELHRLLHDRQVGAVNRAIRQESPRRILECAPGPGRVTRDIQTSQSELTCLEFNEGMILEGKRNCPAEVRWVRGNAFELPFSTPFDLIYSFRFVRHFHREDRDRLYRQFHNALRPGGVVIFDAVNEVISGPLRTAHPEDYPVYDKLYTSEDDIRQEMKKAGFEVTRLEPVQRWFDAQFRMQVLLGPRSRWLCHAAIRTLERLRRGPALEWIVTCRRA